MSGRQQYNDTPAGAGDDGYGLQEIADALGIGKRGAEIRAARESWPYTEVTTQGGKRRLYRLADLPDAVATALRLRYCAPAPVPVRTALAAGCAQALSGKPVLDREALWDRYARSRQSVKDVAGTRLRAVLRVYEVMQSGLKRMEARAQVAAEMRVEGVKGATPVSLARWMKAVEGRSRSDWLALLVPERTGRPRPRAEIDPALWEVFVTDWMRLEKPSLASCHERTLRIAQAQGKTIPSSDTFERRVKAEFSRQTIVLEREGEEAFGRTIPAQVRDRAVYHAMEAVNADGHRADVFVRWPEPVDGKSIGRPLIVAVQDVYSGLILGYQVGFSETADLAQRAFYEAIRRYGIPARVFMDNGKAFASKQLTGGISNRFRFKPKEDEPLGALPALGCEIHWTQPYHGQSKPIERAWRDLADRMAKHPAFAGAYTGNRPDAKPENYQSRAVPLEAFLRVLDEEVAAHNARVGRRTPVCKGVLSFQEAFDASYATATVARASEEQLRMLQQATEVVRANSESGAIKVLGNVFWNERMCAYAGQQVQARFDADAVQAGVDVYLLTGEYVGFVECERAVGFGDTDAARERARLHKERRTLARREAALRSKLDAADVAQQLAALGMEVAAPEAVAPMLGKRRRKSRGRARVREAAVLPDAPMAAHVKAYQDMLRRMHEKDKESAWLHPKVVGRE